VTIPAIRAQLWLRGQWLANGIKEDAYLWVHRGDGRLTAFRLPGKYFGDPALALTLAQHCGSSNDSTAESIVIDAADCAVPLPAAPAAVLPQLSWGDPRHETTRHFAAGLDQTILRALARLNQGLAYDSAANYNRLIALAPEIRHRWLQALERFPLLTALILLTPHRRLDLAGGERRLWRDEDRAVIEAVEQGRDLTGALARHYGISRSLVRHPLCRRPWLDTPLPWRQLLLLLDGIPAHRRPQTLEELEQAAGLLRYVSRLCDHTTDLKRLGATAFKSGLLPLQTHLAHRFAPLGPTLDDTEDFCRAAAAQPESDGLPPERLALSWIAHLGLASLLAASRRWHRFLQTGSQPHPDDNAILPAIVGNGAFGPLQVRELVCQRDFIQEGQTMRHCVATYWSKCRRGRSRIFALTLGENRATAEYAFDPEPEETRGRFVLAQIRGPENTEVAPAMARAAQDFTQVLNAPERMTARTRIAADYLRHDRDLRRERNRLDPESVRQLRRVLDRPPPQIGHADRYPWLRTHVAGYQYHQGEDIEAFLYAGVPLALVREPDNPHDPLAVRIDWRDTKIGYVPRHANAPIAAALDRGITLTCLVARLDGAAPPWQRLEFVILADTPPVPESPEGKETATSAKFVWSPGDLCVSTGRR